MKQGRIRFARMPKLWYAPGSLAIERDFSPVDQFLVAQQIGLGLPIVRLSLTQFRDVAVVVALSAGDCRLRIAQKTPPPQGAQITTVPFASAPPYAVLPEDHPAARKESLPLQDLARISRFCFRKYLIQ
jgi:DNA-binding transcriptional LysR family regulator